jgi:hypothetical protein
VGGRDELPAREQMMDDTEEKLIIELKSVDILLLELPDSVEELKEDGRSAKRNQRNEQQHH